MPNPNSVSEHYTHGALLDAIKVGVERLGKTTETVSVTDLGPVEEFHIGGRVATESFLERLELAASDHVLDVGCGLGGASRFVADRYGARVTGIDLTKEYIETGNTLTSWVGLKDLVELQEGDASKTLFSAASFDKAFLMHVGMNIADKAAVAAELSRVLRKDGILGIYDVMSVGSEDLSFPVPWATSAEESAVSSADEYKKVFGAVGFEVVTERNRRDFALEFFDQLRASTAASGGPPPLGLHILMGETAPLKVSNMIANISANKVAPVELIFRQAS